ncbi:FeFe-hydrogenase 1 [Spironucleus salmonicida]|uniref:FeFe-hydrogenase 1 n=1 Tax=Spironucleus salmonicida TaxID=348837 RepID=K7R8M5_9EUKA|nr:FeFe-hydrogenase 1 [Spironucleus salmonicida]KAH0575659.1 FeFe-hydrogenase 1 [Spironucleus salmonicida]|eukprot:EST47167.1 [FeFe]-hydrogenase 1 [Spironucleus salmonicida]
MPPKPTHTVTGVDSNTTITIDYSTCMGCGMCGRICSDSQLVGAFKASAPKQPPQVISKSGDSSGNTDTTRIKLDSSNCIGCGQCITVCGFGSIYPTSRVSEIWEAKQAGKKLIAVLAPATRVGLSESMGQEPGTTCEAQLIKSLRDIGFDYIFDNLWGADATTIEDAKEAIYAKEKGIGPVFTSCCPAWINVVENKYPSLIPKISTSRSPHGIICSTIKKHWVKEIGLNAEDICVVGFMPCTAKKDEALRQELMTNGVADCDISVTTREMADIFKNRKFIFSIEHEQELKDTKEGQFDAPFNNYSGSAYIFGKTAGVTEAVLRFICSLKNVPCDMAQAKVETLFTHKDNVQTVKVFEMNIRGEIYRAAVAHGGVAVDELVKLVESGSLKCDICEIMMCPLGCQNGGGQPRQMKKPLLTKRADALDEHDKASVYSDCESNKALHDYMDKYMPTEHNVHEVFHTYFTAKK